MSFRGPGKTRVDNVKISTMVRNASDLPMLALGKRSTTLILRSFCADTYESASRK